MNPQIQNLLEKCHELLVNKAIILCMIPSHIGIPKDEKIDRQANPFLALDQTYLRIPFPIKTTYR